MKKKMGRRPIEAVKYSPWPGSQCPWLGCKCGGKLLVYSSPPAKNGVKTRYHLCRVCGAKVKSEEMLRPDQSKPFPKDKNNWLEDIGRVLSISEEEKEKLWERMKKISCKKCGGILRENTCDARMRYIIERLEKNYRARVKSEEAKNDKLCA